MSAPSAEWVERILDAVDPRLGAELKLAVRTPGTSRAPATGQRVVLAGHRSAGKTRILPMASALLGLPGLDLDAELERQSGRSLREWVTRDAPDFRRAERALFEALPPGGLVAVGGGFLSHHAEALAGHFTVVIPISLETYRERLMADTTRPRLRPELSLEEELDSVYRERELLHSRVPTVSLVEWLRPHYCPS